MRLVDESSRLRSSRQPKVVMVTKMEHMPSRRSANQRDVVRNRNQASVRGEDGEEGSSECVLESSGS